MDITRLRLQFDQATKNLENKKKKLKELRTFYKKLQDEELFSEIYVLYRNKYIDQLDDDEKVLNKIISEKKLQINKLEKQIKDFSKSNNFKAKILKSEEILVAKEKNEFLQSVKCSNSQNTPAEILNFSLNRLKEIKELNRKLESLENEYENKNFFELNSLRDALSNYLEIKKKLKELNLDSLHFKSSEDLLPLKLCIGAAFCDRILVSKFEISDEKTRKKFLEMIENKPSNLFMNKIPRNVKENDVKALLDVNKEPTRSIKIINTYALINYSEDVNPRTIKMAL